MITYLLLRFLSCCNISKNGNSTTECDCILFLLLLRVPAADCWCSSGAVHPHRDGRSGQAGYEQGPLDLLPTSHLACFTRGCHSKYSECNASRMARFNFDMVAFFTKSYHLYLFRVVCCWMVCFLWSLLCVRRSWTVTTLPLKVSNVQVVHSWAYMEKKKFKYDMLLQC